MNDLSTFITNHPHRDRPMTPAPIDVAALRRLLDHYHAWQASTDPTMVPYDRLCNALVANAPALLRAVEERDALLAIVRDLVCDATNDEVADMLRYGKACEAGLEAIRRAKEPQ